MEAIAVVGPTASGKSEVALALAHQLDGEIVCCDSVQVYRGFDIGSAKPTAAERQSVAHHCLDVADWFEDFNAQQYAELALSQIRATRERGRTPIVCGGTGLYLRALRFGLAPLPPSHAATRAELAAAEDARPGALHAMLAEVDPDSARRIHPNNRHHLIRAVEIFRLTGQPPSRVRRAHNFEAARVNMRVFALHWPPARLKERIRARSERLLEQGLREEVERLLASGVAPGCRPMRSVGYREACAVALGEAPASGLCERIARSTTAYARRQRTWFRKEAQLEWLDCGAQRDAAAAILAQLQGPSAGCR